MPAAKVTPTTQQPIWLKQDDVCQLLQISKRAIFRFVAAGKFPKPKKFGRLNRWLIDDINAYARGAQA